MRPIILLLAALLLAPGCTSRYHVDRDELRTARSGGFGVAPARDDAGEATWLEVEAIARERPLTAELLEVQASDSRPGLRIAGWSLVGLGLVTATVGGIHLKEADRHTKDWFGQLTKVFFGGTMALVGAALLVPGYAGSGPEAEPPPHINAIAPPRW